MAARYGIVIDVLAETTSTNDAARAGQYSHCDIVVAESQTQGRGQRGNSWTSDPGANLTFSLVLHPRFLAPDRQFLLSEAVSLALADMLESYGIDSRIKWPNDIYAISVAPCDAEGKPQGGYRKIGGGKIAGILIENDIQGTALARSIVGIGLNVNQHVFPAGLPNPVSMIAAGREFDRAEVLERFYNMFTTRYGELEDGQWDKLTADYHAKLHLLDTPHDFTLPDSTRFTGVIRQVLPSGELRVEHPGGLTKGYLFKEIIF